MKATAYLLCVLSSMSGLIMAEPTVDGPGDGKTKPGAAAGKPEGVNPGGVKTDVPDKEETKKDGPKTTFKGLTLDDHGNGIVTFEAGTETKQLHVKFVDADGKEITPQFIVPRASTPAAKLEERLANWKSFKKWTNQEADIPAERDLQIQRMCEDRNYAQWMAPGYRDVGSGGPSPTPVPLTDGTLQKQLEDLNARLKRTETAIALIGGILKDINSKLPPGASSSGNSEPAKPAK